MSPVIVVLAFVTIAISMFCLGYHFRKNQEVQTDPTWYADRAIDTLHHCLSHDSDYKGFKTRMDIARWIEARRNKVQEALNRE